MISANLITVYFFLVLLLLLLRKDEFWFQHVYPVWYSDKSRHVNLQSKVFFVFFLAKIPMFEVNIYPHPSSAMTSAWGLMYECENCWIQSLLIS